MGADARRVVRRVWLIAAIGIIGCLTPVDPSDAPVGSVQVTFDGTNTSDTIQVRGTTRARAAAIARQGYDLGRTDFIFASSNDAVATVEPSGVVRAVAPGTAVVRATLPDGTAGEGTVIVVPSTVEYTIVVGDAPGAMAFSPDYTRLYVTIASDSLAIVDALGYFRMSAVRLGAPGARVAATAEAVYVTHPGLDSVSVIATTTTPAVRRISLGRSPTGVAATAQRAFVALRAERRVAIVEGDHEVASIPVGADPVEVAAARDGRRVFATLESGSGVWHLAIIDPIVRVAIQTVALTSAPGAIATDLSGTRVYVLLPAENRVAVLAEGPDGRYQATGTIAIGTGSTGVSARLVGAPLVVASGNPVTVFDGASLAVSEQIPDVGTGSVAVRPDGVFAFISVVGSNVLKVIGL